MRIFDSTNWGHEMVPMDVADASECKHCGVHFTDEAPCPATPVCKCQTNHREGFSFVGTLGIPVFVCSKCGFPTDPMLVSWIQYCLENQGRAGSE